MLSASSSTRPPHAVAEPRRSTPGNTSVDGRQVDADKDVHRCMIRADVIRLHAIAARTRCHGEAAGQSHAPSIEQQVSQATGSGGTCGALMELLVAKAMEAVSCTLRDMDDGSAADKSHSSSLSFVGPLVAALERLRLLHEKTRVVGRSMVQRKPSKASLGESKARTCEAGAQTEKAVSPNVVASQNSLLERKQPDIAGRNSTHGRPVATKSCGVQACTGHSNADASVQAELGSQPPQAPRGSSGSHSSCIDSGTQTSCTESPMVSRHAGVQTSARGVGLRNAFAQTESGTANSTVRIVRIERMQRLEKQSMTQSSPSLLGAKSIVEAGVGGLAGEPTPAAPQGDAAVGFGSSSGQLSEISQSCSRGSSRDRMRGQRSNSMASGLESIPAVHRSKPNQGGANGIDHQRKAPLLRCPAGHGMQWIRSRRSENFDSCKESLLQCGACSTSIARSASFHSCAVCFRDAGERHAVCSTCSRAMQGSSSNMSRSASMGSLPLPDVASPRIPKRSRSKEMASRASEWSMVSSMLPLTPSVARGTDLSLAVT